MPPRRFRIRWAENSAMERNESSRREKRKADLDRAFDAVRAREAEDRGVEIASFVGTERVREAIREEVEAVLSRRGR